MLQRIALSLVVASAAVAACSDFRNAPVDRVDGGDDAGLSDGPSSDAGGPEVVLAADAGDAGPKGDSPPDFACAEAWTKPNRADPNCVNRSVVVIERGILDTTALSVVVTSTLRVGVAYNSKLSADQGELHVATFARPSSLSDAGLSPAPAIAVLAGSQFDNFGFVARAAAGTGARIHVAYQTSNSEIVYATIDPTGPPSTAETIATGIAQSSEIALAVLPNGDVRAVYYDPSQTTLYSKLRSSVGWGAPTIVHPGISDAGVVGTGQVSEVIDQVGSPHVAFHNPRMSGGSDPRYVQFAGTGWTTTKTLDNADLMGISGFSIALGIVDQTRYAAYYFRPTGAVVAQLRLASWISSTDTPTVTIVDPVLDQSIPSPNASAPLYRVAMATDSYGMIHLAIVTPQTGGTGYLEYRRQKRVAGKISWVSDTVDDNVLATGSSPTLVDIAVDSDARPHLAYYRGADGAVMYATRFDRP